MRLSFRNVRSYLNLLLVLLLGAKTAFGQNQGILREVYSGIPGNSLSDLTNNPAYPDSPSYTNIVTTGFEAPTDVEENYGQRMRGYITPPVSGNYTFWVSSDDNGGLFLSTDSDPANRVLISSVNAWTGPREWSKEANQQSAPISLLAGENYYIEALQKEGGGGDNLAVRWLRPDGVDEGPIPATYLLPFGTSFTPPIISGQPTNTTAVEGQNALFSVKVKNLDSIGYQWSRGGVPIAGAKSGTYIFGPISLDDHNATFSVYLTNKLGVTNSGSATLSVTPDVTAPVLISGINLDANSLQLVFSEPISAASMGNLTHYSVSGGVAVTAAAFGADTKTLLVTTTPMTFGASYTVSVSGLQDRARTPNTIAPGSQLTILALEFVSQGVGLSGGSIQRLSPSAYDVTGGGADIGGGTDQFQYAWEKRSGDFDLQVRVAAVTMTDPFVHAGLMARGGLEANAMFAGVFSASQQVGSFFKSRTTLAGFSTTSGRFPVNYPQQWLRLRRVGNTFTGFGSFDGKTWVQLGSASMSAPATVYVGVAVSAGNAQASAQAQFRDYGVTASLLTGTYTPDREPIGPSSRRTGLIFSEIMYNPKNPVGVTNRLEYVEIYNADSIFEDIGGWILSGGIDFTFPAGFRLRAGDYVVIAADPAALSSVYGLSGVLGPFSGKLSGSGDTLRLSDNNGATKLEMTYSSQPPWPVAPDGSGHSLLLTRPSYGENDARAWGWSEQVGGTPGRQEMFVANRQSGVVINEFLARTDDPVFDFIELYNRNNTPVDLSGCYVTDTTKSNIFRIPDGTILNGRGFIAWDQTQLGFSLSAAGERVYLISSNTLRVIDAIDFGGQENGVSTGRSPDGSDTFRRLSTPTAGAANGPWKVENVVINEIMHNPLSGDSDDEYVELYNRSGALVDLSGWKLKGGIDFKFPVGTKLAAGGYLVAAKNTARLLANYPQLNATNTLGNFSGNLNNSSDHIVLAKPDEVVSTNTLGVLETNIISIAVAEVRYWKGGRWGKYADGGGSSLELIDAHSDALRPSNWAGSDESQKAPWTTVSVTGVLDNGMGGSDPDRLHILMLGEAGETLVDEVEAFKANGPNLVSNNGFESGSGSAADGWEFNGNHSLSGVDGTGAFLGSRSLHIRAQGDGDTGINGIRTALAAGLASGDTATIRARVRWLAGTREMLFKFRGGFLELPARLSVPANLGTPGLANSRSVANAGPAIYEVSHRPALPVANQAVVVTCRVSDPDGIGAVTLRYRVDPNSTTSNAQMRDDGTGGDAVAGDGIYSASILGKPSGTVVGFKISATDAAGVAANSTFPGGNLPTVSLPSPEAFIRWDDPVPAGSFAHYHLWNTQATDGQRGNALNNTFRDATLVYGNFRILYNVGFRDKGSPFHGGGGSFSVQNFDEDPLLGETERIFRATGNGGQEETGLRNQVSMWIGKQMGIPYLHSHYMQLFRNGNLHYNISQDEEYPSSGFAKSWFPSAEEGDLYKIAVWFEFQDDNSGFNAAGATLEQFKTTGNALKLGRYRFNWQTRGYQGTVNNYTNIFNLVKAANDQTSAFVGNLLNLADIEQWMNVFAYDRVLGNWDSWTYNVGQNMYAYKLPGDTWKIMPWDIDFVLGIGDGATAGLWGGQDPVMNRVYDTPAFRRMLWRAYQNALPAALDPARYTEVIDARRSSLVKNNIQGVNSAGGLNTFMAQRRAHIQGQINANDVTQFKITSNNGGNFTSSTASAVITGQAPFAVANITVNGIPYPAIWTDQNSFSITVPLTGASNPLTIAGVDRHGMIIPGASKTITVAYSGSVQLAQNYVVINEVHYNPVASQASFVELYNRSTNTAFDLSGFRLDGVGHTFADGSIIQPGAYAILAKNAAAFGLAYGTTIPVFAEFPGSLDNGGESLRLVKPNTGPGGTNDLLISDVRFDNQLPWPTNADGFGPSLQLVDAQRGSYRVANWAATATNVASQVTPGQANSRVKQTLAAFPEVWLNEVLPNNVAGPADNTGENDPFIELYNAGTNSVDLSALYLTDSFTNLTQWKFPDGTVLTAKQFLVVWADGQPGQATLAAPHTSFRLNPTNGPVALVRLQGSGGAPAVIDYLEYKQIPPGRSFGSSPDGEPRNRRSFYYVTVGATNNAVFPEVALRINEFMAGNTNTIINPTTGKYDDWFELHNGGSIPLDLTSYRLTSALTNTTQFTIPGGYVLPAGGFLLVWADKNSKSNSPANPDLHVNFKLSKTGSQIGLYGPDGALVDSVTFGPQTSDISMGRFPDGADGIFSPFETATPRAANVLAGGNHPPTLDIIPAQSVDEQSLLTFTAMAADSDGGQTLTFSLGIDAPPGAEIAPETGLFTWTPTEGQGPGVYGFTVRVGDNGIPPRLASQHVTVTVREANRPPTLEPVANQTVSEGGSLSVAVPGSDPDLPANTLTYTLEPGAPSGATINPATGQFDWSPTENQGPADYSVTVRVSDNGSPAASATTTFNVHVDEVNSPPTVSPIPAQNVTEGNTLTFTAQATDGDLPAQTLRFSLDPGIPAGAAIDPVTGVFTWTPGAGQIPSANTITLRVQDNGTPPLTGSQTFTIAAVKLNHAPVLGEIVDQTVSEGGTLSLTVAAEDSDAGQTLSYSLEPGAPAGAVMAAASGLLTWSPTETQGPSTNTVTVRVVDNGVPVLADTKTFKIIVKEVNQAPVLAAVADQSVVVGRALTFQIAATDADRPVNALTYTLEAGAPAGAAIDAATGVFSWTPAPAEVRTTNTMTVRVTDNGAPALSDTKTFQVIVQPGSPWQRVVSTGTATTSTLYIYLGAAGEVYLDDLKLVAGTDPDTGPNLLANGDFESALTGPWNVSANLIGSATATNEAHGGSRSLRVVATEAGSSRSSSIFQDITPVLTTNANYTLSYWYLPNASGANLTLRLSGSGITSTHGLAPPPNTAPTIGPIANKTVDESALLSVLCAGQDADNPPQTLTHSLEPGAPVGMTINPATGLVTWTPAEAQGPSTNPVTVRVTDSGSPALSATATFSVIVREQNQAPTLSPVPDQSLDEGGVVTLTVKGSDADLPPQSLTYGLVGGAPAGLTLHPQTGALNWATTEQDGPSTNQITVRVTDSGSPALFASATFVVVVREVNRFPALDPIADQSVTAGNSVVLTARAVDLDLPANLLAYSLDVGAPAYFSINPASGVITLAPTGSAAASTNDLTVRVTDNGTPSLSSTRTLRVIVTPKAQEIVNLGSTTVNTENGRLGFSWNSLPGKTYRILSLQTVSGSSAWTVVAEVTATGVSASFDTPTNADTQRYFRIEVIP